MRNTIIILSTIITVSATAKSYLESPLEVPKSIVIDLNTQECDSECMSEHLKNERVFSFISKYKEDNTTDEFKAKFTELKTTYNIADINRTIKEVIPQEQPKIAIDTSSFRVALLFPEKKIGKYAINSTRSTLAYLISKNASFNLETFNCEDESIGTIQSKLNDIKSKNIKYIIAVLTPEGAKSLLDSVDKDVYVYVPTVNIKDIPSSKSNVYFGGIDYREQTDRLLNYSTSNLVTFYDSSRVSLNVTNYLESKSSIYKQQVSDGTNYRQLIGSNPMINGSNLFLNTPVITSSLILSQVTYNKKSINSALSTQINYTPLLLSLTQPKDREKMVVANSISNIADSSLLDSNKLLDNDIVYDWINYSTLIGIDYLYNESRGSSRSFSETILNNQVVYKTKIFKPTIDRFQEIN